MFNELNLNKDINALKQQYKVLEQQYKNLLLKYNSLEKQLLEVRKIVAREYKKNKRLASNVNANYTEVVKNANRIK